MASSKAPDSSKTPNLGGLDCDFVEDPPDSLKCLICMLVVKDPWQHGECGRVYCRICIQEFMRVKNMCPNCRQENPSLFKDGRSEFGGGGKERGQEGRGGGGGRGGGEERRRWRERGDNFVT